MWSDGNGIDTITFKCRSRVRREARNLYYTTNIIAYPVS